MEWSGDVLYVSWCECEKRLRGVGTLNKVLAG